MMKTLLQSPSAETDKQFIDDALLRSKTEALQIAGMHEKPVSEVRSIQRDQLAELLYGNAKGTDGEHAQGTMQLPSEVEAAINKDHAERMSAVHSAPDAYVFHRTDATVGMQHDGDRKIGLADDVLEDPTLAQRVAKHEGEHRLQETGDRVAQIPSTGDSVIDAARGEIRRLTFRENGAIKAEGGLNGHTEEYEGFVEASKRTAAYIDEHAIGGKSGLELVNEAGKTNEGFDKLRDAIEIAAIRKRLSHPTPGSDPKIPAEFVSRS